MLTVRCDRRLHSATPKPCRVWLHKNTLVGKALPDSIVGVEEPTLLLGLLFRILKHNLVRVVFSPKKSHFSKVWRKWRVHWSARIIRRGLRGREEDSFLPWSLIKYNYCSLKILSLADSHHLLFSGGLPRPRFGFYSYISIWSPPFIRLRTILF
jgi:hypothetical protein